MSRYYVVYVAAPTVRRIFREEGCGHLLPRWPMRWMTAALCYVHDGEGGFIPHHVSERKSWGCEYYPLPAKCAHRLCPNDTLIRFAVELESWERRMADVVEDDQQHGDSCVTLGMRCPIMRKTSLTRP